MNHKNVNQIDKNWDFSNGCQSKFLYFNNYFQAIMYFNCDFAYRFVSLVFRFHSNFPRIYLWRDHLARDRQLKLDLLEQGTICLTATNSWPGTLAMLSRPRNTQGPVHTLRQKYCAMAVLCVCRFLYFIRNYITAVSLIWGIALGVLPEAQSSIWTCYFRPTPNFSFLN